ncbi:MAG: MmgE/PrpD family protein, partial [Vicinamibacterales bacterium]
LTADRVIAQRGGGRGGASQLPVPPPGSAPPDEWRPHTGPGYHYEANRLGSNGPMDETTEKIVKYVHAFSEQDLTPSVVTAVNRTMVDSMASAIAGFEEDAVRVAAKTVRRYPAGAEKCTVLGYGIVTTPEHASFVNSAMVRLVDFNDTPHHSNLIPAALAMGEALHATGAQVMAAVTIGYEVMSVGGGESVGPAMAAGKLMGLDEDRLANAVTLALTPHVALNKGVGAMSMWKGCRSAEAIKCGVWAAILARDGMTGPPQPFEGRGGLWYSQGRMGRPFTLPAQAKLQIERGVNKRFPSDQQTQQVLALIPQMRAWTKPDEIASIDYFMTFGNWEEVGDAPKWDPHNRDTADHSIPYTLARNLIDGDSYLDAFALEKLPFRDPVVRALMDKINLYPVAEWQGNGTARVVIRKKSGEERYWDTHDGSRNPGDESQFKQMSDDDITNKFKRVCAFRHIADQQRDEALAQWWDLRAIKDIAVPMKTLATFGRPVPL